MKYFLSILLFLFTYNLQAQNSVKDAVLHYLEENKAEWQLTTLDLQYPLITDEYMSRHNGVTHLYMRQTHAGIEVLNAIINANVLSDGNILNVGNRFVSDLSGKINATTPVISALEAVQVAVREVDMQATEAFFIQNNTTPNEYEISDGGIAASPIKVKLMYLPMPENEVRLIWQLGIYTKNHQHNWKLSVDAITGQILKQRDAVLHCDFGAPHTLNEGCKAHAVLPPTPSKEGDTFESSFSHSEKSLSLEGARGRKTLKSNLLANAYNVYPAPVESPIHGERALMVNPADATASPFGWHDTDGVAGPEYTFTQGNNVRATEDIDNDGGLGYVPDGGDSLVFDFLLDLSEDVVQNLDASITNLFYWNNIIHDVWYQYGFDEVSGNFQENNYERGGTGGDFVIAEVHDGSGINNANFSAPQDGANGRMQMFLWNSTERSLTVNTPSGIADSYENEGAAFGPPVFNVTGMAVEAYDASASPSLVCEPITNVDEVAGNVAIIDRQDCNFTVKVRHAQDAGAIAVIMCNHELTGSIPMGGTDGSITIPSMMLSNQDCAIIRAEIAQGQGVEVTMASAQGETLDSGFDNGIITHEYGHGVSIRLTGGPNNSGCLDNGQQMGEGWSDWLTLVMTPVSDSDGTIARGIGNYASGGTVSSTGIRTYPYSTDMTVNPHTYSAIPADTEGLQHLIGSIWCAMIWDLYWGMVDVYGFDDDIYNGTGGNNMAMQLVIDGMKMQSCNPTFIDGRDAILLADEALYQGANRCLIWEVFARRGLGNSAVANNTANAFDLPPFCVNTVPPITEFSSSEQESCRGEIQFTDMTENFPNTWAWDFGDGNTSTEQNPLHIYAQDGTYTVTLEASNDLGTNSKTKVDYIIVDMFEAPHIQGDVACDGGIATLTASTNNGIVEWLDSNGNTIGEGDVLVAPPFFEPTTLYARSTSAEVRQVGPEDSSYGTGGYHDTEFRGQVFCDVTEPFELVSVWINAGSAGEKQFDLETINGEVVHSVIVNITEVGPQRVNIGWNVVPGQYAMAAESVNLYRNDSGTTYPYVHPSGAVTLTGPSPSADTGFYYYFYDWEVKTGCESESVSIDVDCISVGIDNNPAVEMINVFPNPNDGTFALELLGEAAKNLELTVFNVLGKAIYQDRYDFYSGQLNTQIELPNIAAGTFYIKLNISGKVSYQKIVVY